MNLTNREKDVLKKIKGAGCTNFTINDVVEITGLRYRNTQRIMSNLREKGAIERIGGNSNGRIHRLKKR